MTKDRIDPINAAHPSAGKIVANASIGFYRMLEIPRFLLGKCTGLGQFSLYQLYFTAIDPALFDQNRFKSVKPCEKVVVPTV